MIRVVVVRDEGYFGVAVRAFLETEPDMHYVDTLPIGGDLAQRAAQLWPAVVVIDTQYMVSQVLPLADQLHAAIPSCSMLLLCDPSKRGMLPPRRWNGGLNFLVKDTSPAMLADTVRRLARGERVVSPMLQAASLNTDRGLSTRELEVLGLAAEGESVKEIAGRLYLSSGTVRNYLSAIISKTRARNRLDAIRIARKEGWLR
ncbi:DNA-binding response regulator [Actinoplanes italicus]|uniref:Two-component system response regulator DesR n=1 Tax=Actinoplanes italicus TaxID=113567 RepID=A0A2T0K3Y4_9ACTN|nr:response regulator transcription factor [Actinoplanes italicus]PRX17584.1 two-component system response regulator DesR [Actinoplanes italicus]GIE34731.1 DNA-binding response regulator [Actinoplanes italicus]